MSKSKRDIIILIVIGLILYGVIYYNFVLVDALAKVEDINNQIETVSRQKENLERDLANIKQLQRSLEMKTKQDERLQNYLMSEANLSSNIEYVDKLIKLFNNKITNSSISAPASSISEKTKTNFYEFKIELSAMLSYEECMNLINYLEGGSQKVKITKFNLTPTANAPAANGSAPQNPANSGVINEGLSYSINMAVSLYSLNLGSLDKVYEYSRHRFTEFEEGDGVVFAPSPAGADSGTATAGIDGSAPQNIAAGKDIQLKIESFLAAGTNFWTYGAGNSSAIEFKTKDRVSVKMTFNGDSYSVEVVNASGHTFKTEGRTQNKDINLFLKASYPTVIEENKNLGADIQIINNSNKKIGVTLDDKSRCIKLKDRNGNLINGRNDTEKLYVL